MYMTTYEKTNGASAQNLESVLREMLGVLEQENNALLKGDAKLVGELSEEKLKLSDILDSFDADSAGLSSASESQLAIEVRGLGRQVRELAKSNHLLIEHMNQHYTGILSLIMKITGHTQTYKPNGYMSSPTRLQRATRREIIA